MNSEENNQATAAQAAPSSPAEPASTTTEASEATQQTVEAPAAHSIDAAKAAASEPENFNANVRIAKDSSVRKLISFVMSRLERGGTVTLQALNMCVHKAIMIALICRDRLGNIHQVNSLLVVQETKESDKSGAGADETTAHVRSTSGIQIILSKSPLDKNEVGYEKPKPKGFAMQSRPRRRPYRPRQAPSADETQVVEKTPAKKAATAPSEKTNESRRGRKDKPQAEPTPDDAKDAPQPRRKSKRPRRMQVNSDEKEAEKKPERKEQERTPPGEEGPKVQRGRSRQSRTKAADREQQPRKTEAAEVKQEAQFKQGRRARSRREPAPPQQQQQQQTMQQNRNRSTRRGRDEREDRRPSTVDYDYMGREVPRNDNRRTQAPPNGYYDSRESGGRPGYQRRGAPYEVGQSYRYMPNFREDRDPYFSQYDRPRGGGGAGYHRGGRDQPRPGYFPAARRPQRVDQLVDDFGGYRNQGQQQRRY